ncbi:MAG: UbiH/UbiF/VisC/COQ6 family ubiquinone biosynthesis hydroxylase [Gammaproteobacteria bacterium]|nr:UbiH/UbiF/VisC/COQ6 family ubiquinone biosynthesis hydroxylase [Gammaproteobacteria bacterium]MCP5136983.1 UbiH/UbiF/VisC/COQ6 family ubiquinone biosynthesis hydroxylase [Gammaproteobacteria bacterium]
MSDVSSYDVCIVGGGMIGAALGCALGDSGMRVAVLEAQLPDEIDADDPPDLRVSAITRASQNLFAAVGAWPGMVARRVSPYRHMTVWDARGEGQIEFDAADVGEDDLGYIIENRVVQLALLARLRGFENVELIAPCRLGHIDWHDAGARVELDDGRILDTRLVVGADGARSRVREMAGIGTQGWNYDQHGLVCAVRPEFSHRNTAWQRFLATGPLAFLPLSDGRCSIVWSTSPEEIERLQGLSDAEFSRALAEALDYRLGQVLEVGPRAAFPLRLMNAEEYVAPGLALVGDAAHNIHPLAGQGANLGFMDVAALAEVLNDAYLRKRNLGGLPTLRRYARWRKGEVLTMMAAMDGLKRLFGSGVSGVGNLRRLGLSITNSTILLKGILTRRAMGLAGDLPGLARRN